MNSSFLSSVPKLKGRENYDDWAFAVQNLLVLEDTDKYLKQEAAATDAAQTVADTRARAKLILTIDASLFVHIKETKTTKELWTKLKALFDDSGFSRRITLLRHLISIRLETCENMTSYVTQIVETSQRLSGTGFIINDDWVGSLLLAGLPDKFMPMIMAIEHSGMQITADSIKTKLLDMENGGSVEANGNDNSAFIARSWQKKKHSKVGSNSKHGGPTPNIYAPSTSMSNDRNNKTITCYKCKQSGHFMSQCPFKNEKTEKKKQTNAFSVVFLSGNFNKCDWYIDSGASTHMTANESWLTNRTDSSSLPEITIANNMKVPVLCAGDVKVTTSYGYEVTVKNVLCVPTLATNLLSVSELIRNGNSVVFEPGRCLIKNRLGNLVAEAELVNNVYKLILQNETCLLSSSTVDGQTWHRRLGHLNSTDMNKMKQGLVNGMDYLDKFVTSKSSCEICCEGKQARLPFSTGTRATEILQIIHSDICGPMECKSIGGARYFLLFIDDFTRMTFIYFLKYKSETLTCFKEFKSMVENFQNRKIKILRTDNGCEYCSNDFRDFLKHEGVIHQKSNAYTPEQNGLSERSNRTVVERARCLLFEAELDKKFWAEAANTAVYLKNRSTASGIEKTPYEMWFGRKPDLQHLRVFGSPVMVHTPKEKRAKWDRKSTKHILVGYSDNVKGYRIYNPVNNKVTTSRDVIIQEKPQRQETVTVSLESTDSVGELVEESVVKLEPVNKSSSSESDYLDVEDESLESEAYGENLNMEQTSSAPQSTEEALDTPHAGSTTPVPEVTEKRQRRKPDRYGFANMCCTATGEDGLTYAEAISGPERLMWLQAMTEELQSFQDNQAWEVVDTPSNASVVQCKWVFKKKTDSDNKVVYRARLVAKGFTQKAGIDYQETFSPVIRHSTLRLLFAISVQLGMDITHLDVKTAFLNGHLKESIFMHLPEGFPMNSSNKVLKLRKAVYGLKQSSLAWYNKVEEILCKSGFKKCKLEPCVFVNNHSDNKKTIVGLYVDDFLVFSNCKSESDNLIDILSKKFKVKNLGRVRNYLGMRVDKSTNVVTLDQERYIDQLLEKFDMSECHAVETPIECKLNVNKSNVCEERLPFQKLIGSLMYLAVLTRPDIAYSVSYLSQFNNCYSYVHWNYAKRILKYLSQTKTYCLKYSKESAGLVGFVDADWASDATDRRSYTGFCFTKSGSAISWESKKQRTVALSSCEAEYMALSEACREAIYLQKLEFEIIGTYNKIVLYNDSQSALKLANNYQSHKRSKHIDVRYHFIREVLRNDIIEARYLSTANMPADLLTKGLPSVKHYKFMKDLGIVNLE